MINAEKFRCISCGKCCRNFVVQEEDKEIPRFENAITLVINPTTLPLFDFELKTFQKFGMEDQVVPSKILFDTKSNVSIILERTLKSNFCPFIDDNNKCKIYSERPSVCRMFPCNINLDSEKKEITILAQSRFCSSERPLNEIYEMLGLHKDGSSTLTNPRKVSKLAYFRYGEAYAEGMLRDVIEKSIAQRIAPLEKNKLIKLAKKGYDLKYLIKRVHQSQSLGASELIEKSSNYNITEHIDSYRKEIIAFLDTLDND